MSAGGIATLPDSPTQQALRRFVRHRPALVGLVILGLVVGLAVFAPIVAPLDPLDLDIRIARQPPSARHWFGVDLVGRDVWSRVVYGARTSLIVGFGATSLFVVIGTTLGIVAGFLGRWVDQVIMRITDVALSMPSLLVIIIFVSIVGPSLTSVIFVIGLFGWASTARLVRGQVLALREAEFVTAARVVGASGYGIMVHHILPNIVGILAVVFTFGVASSILTEAGLSFLGLGVPPPTPSLGVMINEAQSPTVLFQLPWVWVTPGVAIAITVVGMNFVGDGLRDAVDPKG